MSEVMRKKEMVLRAIIPFILAFRLAAPERKKGRPIDLGTKEEMSAVWMAAAIRMKNGRNFEIARELL